jgi:uncharacterized membrane protein YoaK (UPF0700 family)
LLKGLVPRNPGAPPPVDASSPPAAQAAQALRGLAFVLAVPLIAANGSLDAYTFPAHDRVFANAQTGNVVLFALGLVRRDIAAPLPHLWPVLAFIAGVALARTLHNPADTARPPRPRRWVLIAEVVVLGFIAAAPSALPLSVIVSLISFFSALQLSLFRTVESLTFVPIAMTGNLLRATEAIHAAASGAHRERRTAIGQLILIAVFAGGVVLAQSPPRISAAAPPRFPPRCSHST